MFELSLVKLQTQKSNDDDDDDSVKKASITTTVVVLTLYFLILLWAITRALRCSYAKPDSRAIHFIFCFMSPTLYLACSYLVPGFCK